MNYSYRISWILEGRIIGVVLEGDLASAPDEFMQAFDDEINAYIDQGTAPLVHSIGDMHGVTSMPDIRVMSRIFTFAKNPHFGWQTMIGLEMHPAVKFVSYLMAQIFRTRTRMVKSIDEAQAFLQQVDKTLPDLSGLTEAWTQAG